MTITCPTETTALNRDGIRAERSGYIKRVRYFTSEIYVDNLRDNLRFC
jgi:hypothetical protein